jgi:DNA polymerase-3 subunit gamma/tau
MFSLVGFLCFGEMRDLRDKVHIAPTSAKYKVYIIDEVHMLTREAFNALLKTLEEPPAHAVFILATTEAHKVPDTIASRTQRFSFKPINRDDTVGHLKDLAKQEKISITDDALEALAEHAGGSFRDSINLLDQMIGTGDSITKDDVEHMLGLPNPAVVDTLYGAIQNTDVVSIARLLADARVSGLNAGMLAKALGERIRSSIIESGTAPDIRMTQLLRQLVLAATERDAYAGLELALFDYAATSTMQTPLPAAAPAPTVKKTIPKAEPAPLPPEPSTPEPAPEPQPAPEIAPAPEPQAAPAPLAPVADVDFWNALLATIKQSHNTVYSVLRMARPHLEGDELTLAFNFAFHHKQMSQANNQSRIAEAASTLLGRPIAVVVLHQKNAEQPQVNLPATKAKQAAPTVEQGPSPLNDVSSIFQGAELIE